MTVVAVIVHYGRDYDSTVSACISLCCQSVQPDRVYVVDNGPEFGRVHDAVRSNELTERGVIVCTAYQNLGFAEGANLGLRAALEEDAEFILVCNSDAVLDPLGLEYMIATLKGDNLVGCTGPLIRNVDGSTQSGLARLAPITGRPISSLPRRSLARALPASVRGPVYCLSGACLLFRREALEAVGLFDPRYFCYWEESDWFERCAASGWHVALSPRAVLIHAQGGSGSDAFELFHVLRNWRIYLKDHRSRPVRLFARVALWAFVLRVAITSTQNGNWRLSLVALQASVARLPACCSEAIAAAAPFSAPAVSAKWS
jgi:N-acetylglucosaminyl-diphospho-decaprenol L-rhamnosyltransferase